MGVLEVVRPCTDVCEVPELESQKGVGGSVGHCRVVGHASEARPAGRGDDGVYEDGVRNRPVQPFGVRDVRVCDHAVEGLPLGEQTHGTLKAAIAEVERRHVPIGNLGYASERPGDDPAAARIVAVVREQHVSS